MRFRFASIFPITALRRPSSAPCNQQCRPYAPFRHHNTLNKKDSIPHTHTHAHISTHFFTFRSFCSSNSSKSGTGFLAWYLRMLESRPILTKSLSAAFIFAAADVTSQVITMKPDDTWDAIRTMRMTSFGLVILGPAQHVWFNFAGRLLPKRDILSTLKKLAMGQAFFGPTVNAIFFSYNAALRGENGNEIAGRLKRDLIPTMLNGLMYWPICDFLTYKVIPVHLQPLMNSSCSFLWTIYLTYMASLEKAVPS